MTIRMRDLLSLCALLLACIAVAADDERAENPPQVIVTQERANATYTVGETVTYTIAVRAKGGAAVDGTMKVHITLTQDGGTSLAQPSVLEISDKPATIEHTIEGPGFVRLTAIGRSWEGKRCYVKTFSVAACEPEKLEPVVTMPADFDAFWEAGRKRLAAIPPDIKQERIDDQCTEDYEVFKISFANINDTRIYGYLLVPTSGKASYPALVSIAPAGKGKPREDFVVRQNQVSRNEAICLYMGVYDHDLGETKEFYRAYTGKDGDVRSATGVAEDYFFYRAILGIDRAVTWLAEREDVDKTRVVYTGSSQGGGMGLVITGLNSHITAANVNIPALCDHLGYQVGRQPGWPGVLGGRGRAAMAPEKLAAIEAMLPYFDAVNFSRKIQVPILLSMGYLDTTCPPSGIYAAYNSIGAQKQIIVDPNMDHGASPSTRDATAVWIREKLGLAAQPATDGE